MHKCIVSVIVMLIISTPHKLVCREVLFPHHFFDVMGSIYHTTLFACVYGQRAPVERLLANHIKLEVVEELRHYLQRGGREGGEVRLVGGRREGGGREGGMEGDR